MSGFAPQPDEGYSEHPLTAFSAAVPFSLKSREDALTALSSSRSRDEFPPWLIQHLSSLSITRKTELAMALLHDLPTTVISQIVENLHPRLYIDFVRYLPPEVCLKILEYLDPVSLINVARCCRAWYDLALDRKLWEQLYYLEGWKAVPAEIAAAEREVNEASSCTHAPLQRPQSGNKAHAQKKRALSLSPTLDADTDTVMLDVGSGVGQGPTDMGSEQNSIFGGPHKPAPKSGMPLEKVNLDSLNPMTRSSSKSKAANKGKGRALSPREREPAPTKNALLETVMDTPRLANSTLWARDGSSSQTKINWKYLYTMRRRLESNWERGKYVNFQFPHPAYPEEGHGECVYSLQHNSQYLVSGSRDRTLKVWDMKSRRCLRTMAKHRGSVLCLQFDSSPEEDLIVSGSSDSDVIIWRFSTGEPIQTLKNAHRESVLNVRFDQRILVTCSKDKTIKIYNRKPLRHGDLGYQTVGPVPTNVKDYGYSLPMTPDDFPVVAAWTLIGCLEGHGAAVNAVQIHDREVVSASGDRFIKVWDWPTQVCTRTIVGHHKGIACVQYDGRRIVSGSSDNEVKVFDRQTGLEVATLRAHSNLVRTVQAGFGDLPYSVEDDAAEAKKVDQEYFKAVELGLIDERERPRSGRRPANAGSRRPEDICAYGAKLPPGGGGGKYGRVVSGSYDASIIIWRRDKEGVWKDQHHFKQETAAIAALQHDRAQSSVPLHPSVQSLVSRDALRAMRIGASGPSATTPASAGTSTTTPTTAPRPGTENASPGPSATGQTLPPLSTLTTDLGQADGPSGTPQQLRQVIDNVVQGGQHALAQALTAYPQILSYRSYVEACIDRQQNPVVRSQLRQTYSSALIRAQFEQARQRREALRNQEAAASGSSTAAQASTEGTAGGQLTPAQLAAASTHQAHAQAPAQGASMHQLQYDARRIICCSQRSVIVGWDFCNGDPELEEACRFFGSVD
ncbi:WD40 repeat-like protein [Parathielavia hyrcaniae]|uniref:WD40 repeat-like protein n=1 Tax=Parathielavia hyrcaniae TaxID=113614 RepID=A0AAN6Q581_9PEZI|nr:WD40 repeat-like protein [Parathielavia hyrcaniae]